VANLGIFGVWFSTFPDIGCQFKDFALAIGVSMFMALEMNLPQTACGMCTDFIPSPNLCCGFEV
jgi:hypothetical protein